MLIKPSINSAEKELIRIYKNDLSSLSEMVMDVKKQNKNNEKILINVNQEGGRLNTIDWSEMTIFPTFKALGMLEDENIAYEVGRAKGAQLKSLGITWNLSPCCDLQLNKTNTAIGTRSFGMNPKVVACLVAAYIKGLQKSGVAATAKHFVGVGKSDLDSHEQIPIVDTITNYDLIPFISAIKQNVASIMLGNIIVKSIDKVPAFMSKKIVCFLREELNYKGVLVTENISIVSLMKKYSLKAMAVSSIKAGVDIVMFNPDFAKEKKHIIYREIMKITLTF